MAKYEFDDTQFKQCCKNMDFSLKDEVDSEWQFVSKHLQSAFFNAISSFLISIIQFQILYKDFN
jgi:hypothetical protein